MRKGKPRLCLIRHKCKNDQGIALFLVLWILALLSVIVGEFCHTMRAEIRMTADFAEGARAYYAAYAGLQKGIEELVKTQSPLTKRVQENNEGGEENIEWRVNADIPPIPFGDEVFRVRIDNESGKVNINRADGQLLRIIFERLVPDDHDKDVIVDSILDWRDADQLHRLNGAEDDYYKQLPEPYECKDGDFDSIEELRLVRGITDAIFYGGLKDMVTVFGSDSSEKKTTKKRNDVFNKVNINAASFMMLASLPMMTDDIVKEIQAYRAEKDFTSMSELIAVVGPDAYTAVIRYLTLTLSPYYTIHSTGTARDGLTREGLSVVIKMDVRAPKRYVMIKWDDSPEDIMKSGGASASPSGS